MENKESVIDKIRKLLALAERNNSVNEAASAAALAQNLMFEHKLSSAEIETPDEPEDALGTSDFDAPGHLWKKSLVHGISRAFYCRAVTLCRPGLKDTVRIVGKTSDTQSCTYMASYLINEIETLAKDTCKGMGRAYINSFKVGAVGSILNRLQEQRKTQDTVVQQASTSGDTSTALVFQNNAQAVKDYFRELFPKTTKGSRMQTTNHNGYQAGKVAGLNVSLGGGRGIGSKAKQLT